MVNILTAEKFSRYHFLNIQDMVWDWCKNNSFSSYEIISKTCAIVFLFLTFLHFGKESHLSFVVCSKVANKIKMELRNKLYALPFA